MKKKGYNDDTVKKNKPFYETKINGNKLNINIVRKLYYTFTLQTSLPLNCLLFVGKNFAQINFHYTTLRTPVVSDELV